MELCIVPLWGIQLYLPLALAINFSNDNDVINLKEFLCFNLVLVCII